MGSPEDLDYQRDYGELLSTLRRNCWMRPNAPACYAREFGTFFERSVRRMMALPGAPRKSESSDYWEGVRITVLDLAEFIVASWEGERMARAVVERLEPTLNDRIAAFAATSERKRGRPAKIPDERKQEALRLLGEGASRAEIAKVLYDVGHPTPQQVKGSYAILEHFQNPKNNRS